MTMMTKATESADVGWMRGGRAGRHGATVLVIDDDEDTREVLLEILGGAGHDVVLASDGGEAIAWLTEGFRPAVIMLDVMMPVVNGFAFRTWQRARPELAGIAILLATAAPLPKEALVELAPDICLDKPFDLRTLLDSVQTLVDRTRALQRSAPSGAR